MSDNYANYFCQKLFCHLEKAERLCFLMYIRPFVEFIAKNKIGTYPLQNIIEILQEEEEKKIVVESFKNLVLELSFVLYICLSLG